MQTRPQEPTRQKDQMKRLWPERMVLWTIQSHHETPNVGLY
jgi:hypothetical protein